MTILPRVQQIVDEISQKFDKIFLDDASLIWFGSWVRGDAYLSSDIDLAIKHNKPLKQTQLLKFQDYLDDIPTLYSIDLIDIDCANNSLKMQIKKYGKIL